MLEKDIENLIAKYPDEFFPKSGFKLIGQQIKLGRCYADIIFSDKHKRKIIVEVKRGILSRDASGQVMEYYGLLKTENDSDIVELVLCANIIPAERKKFLEAIGIECYELGINLINEIAERYKYKFIDSKKHTISEAPKDDKIIEPKMNLAEGNRVWIFQADPKRYDIIGALSDSDLDKEMHWQVNRYLEEIHTGDVGILWLSGKESGIYAITKILTEPSELYENEMEKKYWIDTDEKEKRRLRVKMRIIDNLLHKPLLKVDLKNNEVLKNMSIIKLARGTNFPVSKEEWKIIQQLIK
ncbi:MAG: endonuclease NucS domain-containing protein [Bacteroidota bacterium]